MLIFLGTLLPEIRYAWRSYPAWLPTIEGLSEFVSYAIRVGFFLIRMERLSYRDLLIDLISFTTLS